ncbi:MAG: winged helix DNA-binding protein [Dongiaceae bacterium]
MKAPTGKAGQAGHSASAREILDAMLAQGVDRDGYRIGLWANFYTVPVFAEIERRFGLLRDENNILFCLAHYGSLTARSICEVTARPKNSVSRAVEKLLRAGLIRRETDPEDRRKGVLTITPEGRDLLARTSVLFQEREALMLRRLTAADRRTLDRLLTKLMAGIPEWGGPF